MKNEVERLLRGRGIDEHKKDKTLTENLREWRKARNITKADYLTFVGNVLEELLEPLYKKNATEKMKQEILNGYFFSHFDIEEQLNKEDILDAIQDIQVFCINETELMGYDNIKCNSEVFKHINCRKQDPIQKEQWAKFGAYGKWLKSEREEDKALWYEPDYESCKL
jgi:hypothetical protein